MRRLNKELEAVKIAVKRARDEVGNAEEGMSNLGRRILKAQQNRNARLRGTHSSQIRINRSKMGGSRRGRKGRKGRKSTRRGRR